MIDRVVGLHQRESRLVVKVSPLALHFLMRIRQQCHGLAAPITALLTAAHTSLGRLERAFGFPLPTRGKDARAIRQGSERFYAEVYASFLSCRRPGLYRHIRT